MGEQLLKCSDCEKDIGIQIDEHLTFHKHINYIIKKANGVLAVTRKSFEYMDCEIFKYLYKGLVRPHLEYATPVWNPYLKSQIKSLEAVQIRATKMVPGLSDKPYPERLKLLDIPTLAYRRFRGDMIHVYKLMCEPAQGAFDPSIPPPFKLNPRTSRDHNKKLVYNRFNSNIRKFNFTVRTVQAWNSLPQYIIDSENIIQFEKELDAHWKTQEIYYDNYESELDLGNTHV